MRLTPLLCGVLLCFTAPAWSDDHDNAPKHQDLTSLSLEQLANITVEGAALHEQSLEDAPASVTIITAEDIYKYGYRTLGEALASVRGFYTSYNRTYHTVGVRGFNLPGDYATRLIVMVNGHNMADNIGDFMLYFGEDFPIEMSLIRRIEIIRGPSSALYGSNGMFATINIITKAPADAGPSRFITTFDSLGERKGQVAATAHFGDKGKALFSGSVFNNVGQSSLFFPEFDAPQSNFGRAVDMDNEKGYHFFSSVTWINWSITAGFSDRKKIQPISWGPTIFNDRGTHVNDARNFIEAAYTRELARGTLVWRTSYDSYHELNRFDFALPSSPPSSPVVEDNRQDFLGDWIGSQLTYQFDAKSIGSLTVGASARFDLQGVQQSKDVSPVPAVYLNINKRDRSAALFVQDERSLSARWRLDLGLRFDDSTLRPDFLSPRAALIYQPSSVWSFKFLYGRAFRDPSLFELFFDDRGRSGAPNVALLPERADTWELDIDRKAGKWRITTAVYAYWLRDFIVGKFTPLGVIQYWNSGNLHSAGVEAEISGHALPWLEANTSYAFQRTADFNTSAPLENSPHHLAKLRLAVPLRGRLSLTSGMQYQSSLRSLAGNTLGSVYLADCTLASRRLLPNFDFRFGIRNAFNRTYYNPIALSSAVDAMQQPGRSVFIELTARARE